MKRFMDKDFLLETKTASRLYHTHAVKMPIFDYHCHLPEKDIAEDRVFGNITQAWLAGDHYKWRAMRSNGVAERFITGSASDEEKFMKWAETVPFTLRNPLYHWTHLELKRYFGVNDLLSPGTAKKIYEHCSAKLRTKQYSVRGLLRRMNVKALCTTNDPCDSLSWHDAIRKDGFEIKVLPAFRPDKAMAVDNPKTYNDYLDNLEKAADTDIRDYDSLITALDRRHDFFHSRGCRLSDHGLSAFPAAAFTAQEVNTAFKKVRAGKRIDQSESDKLRLSILLDAARMNARRNWTMQLHLAVMRNNNTRMFMEVGPDTGFDSIGDYEIARPLAAFMDKLDQETKLPRTVIYSINPRDNDLLATMIGNFQDGKTPGKIQLGSGWWFLDQKQGMEAQMNSLSNMGLLSRFVGMLTDSRSFLSYPRHEYFRRILCNLLGSDAESGQVPADMKMLGEMVENICYNNAKNYFGIELD